MIVRAIVLALLLASTAHAQATPRVLLVESPDALALSRRVEAELGALGFVSERVSDDGRAPNDLAAAHDRRALIRVRAESIEIWLASESGAVSLDETMPVTEDGTAPLRAVERLRAASWEPEPVPVAPPIPEPPPPTRPPPPAPPPELARIAVLATIRFGEGLDGPLAHVAIEGTACVHLATPCDLSIGLAALAPTMPATYHGDAGVVSIAVGTIALAIAYAFDVAPFRIGPRLTLGALVYAIDAAALAPFRAVAEVRAGFDATLGLTAEMVLLPFVATRLDVAAEVALPILEAYAGSDLVARVGPWGGRVALGVVVSIR